MIEKRIFLLILILSLAAFSCAGSSPGGNTFARGDGSSVQDGESQGQPSSSGSQKILVVYFSQTGNTRTLANLIHQETGGDIFRIETAIPYSSDMAALAKRKNQELESGNMPELKAKVEDIVSYDVIFLGYPIWAMTAPTPVRSFIETHDLAGKIIVPFCTHDGYGPGRSVSVIKDLLPSGTTVLNVFDTKGADAGKAAPLVKAWLKKLNIKKGA